MPGITQRRRDGPQAIYTFQLVTSEKRLVRESPDCSIVPLPHKRRFAALAYAGGRLRVALRSKATQWIKQMLSIRLNLGGAHAGRSWAPLRWPAARDICRFRSHPSAPLWICASAKSTQILTQRSALVRIQPHTQVQSGGNRPLWVPWSSSLRPCVLERPKFAPTEASGRVGHWLELRRRRER